MPLFTALLLLATVGTALAAPMFDRYLINPNTSTSQTCIGTFVQPLTAPNVQYADWVLDLENQRLRITVGNATQAGYTQYLTFSNLTYVVKFNTSSNSLYCNTAPTNFQNVLSMNLFPYLRYLGDAAINNLTYHMYAGVSSNLLTQSSSNTIAFYGNASSAFPFMPVLNTNGFNYYAFTNVTIGTPDASYYTVPSVCGVTTVSCSPACGSNAQCVNQMCVCYNGYVGNATNGCTASVSIPQSIGTINITYDQFVLQTGADAVSQTCLGSYTNPITGVSVYSAWVQNLQSSAIRWDIGMPGVSGSKTYYFMPTQSFTVTYTLNNGMTCSESSQITFTQVFNNMFYPSMRYLGVNIVYNNVLSRMYVGTGVPNPDTNATSMIKYISTSGSQFYFLAMLNAQGYTYYDYPNVTLGTPASSWFIIPPACFGITLPGTGLDGSGTGSAVTPSFFFSLIACFAIFLLRSH